MLDIDVFKVTYLIIVYTMYNRSTLLYVYGCFIVCFVSDLLPTMNTKTMSFCLYYNTTVILFFLILI